MNSCQYLWNKTIKIGEIHNQTGASYGYGIQTLLYIKWAETMFALYILGIFALFRH